MPRSLHQDQTDSRAAPSKALTRLAVAFSLLAAAACSTRSEFDFATLRSEVPATQSIIVPPPGGPSIVAVLQRNYENGVSQEIALATASSAAGQNAFHVSVLKENVTQWQIENVLTIPELTDERIQTEMEERLPGIDMRVSLVYTQNKYGPFGFAVGHAATGDLCLYAWQQIEPNEPAILFEGGIISVRLRLCDADATPAQLLRTMYGYTISGFFSSETWNPYGEPPPPPAYIGQIDAPIHPVIGTTKPAGMSVSRQVISRPVIRSRRVIDKDTVLPAPAPAPSRVPAPLEDYPVVPPPP